jgi:hypothetical protein
MNNKPSKLKPSQSAPKRKHARYDLPVLRGIARARAVARKPA